MRISRDTGDPIANALVGNFANVQNAAEPHDDWCNTAGFLGIAFLPKNYWEPLSVWPGWRHLEHGEWEKLIPEYRRITKLSTEALLRLLD